MGSAPYIETMKTLDDTNVAGERVLLRIDANVPLSDDGRGTMLDDYRLKAIVPTIRYLLDHKAQVIVLSRLGRPKGKVVPELSLRPIYQHLGELLGEKISFINEPVASVKKRIDSEKSDLSGLENLRFYPEEEANSPEFAKQLASLGDIYVNDSFSEAHRSSASLVEITKYIDSCAGLVLEREYKVLTSLLRNPARPFCAIIGGAKIDDKLPAIKNLLDRVDCLLLGGGVANTFLAADGEEIGQSLVDRELIPAARELLKRGRGKIVLPTDVAKDDGQILDIGVKTAEAFGHYIAKAKTIFWSGNLGKTEDERFLGGSKTVARAIAESGATSVIGGGNTVELINKLGLASKMTFVSTGGSATLKLLAGEKLPAIEALASATVNS